MDELRREALAHAMACVQYGKILPSGRHAEPAELGGMVTAVAVEFERYLRDGGTSSEVVPDDASG